MEPSTILPSESFVNPVAAHKGLVELLVHIDPLCSIRGFPLLPFLPLLGIIIHIRGINFPPNEK